MRRLSALALAGLALVACADDAGPTDPVRSPLPAASPATVPQESAYVPGRVLVRFAPGADAPGLARAAGGQVDRQLAVGVHVVSVPVGAEARAIEALSRNPGVVFAEPDLLRLFGDPLSMPADDRYIGYKWDLDNDGSIYSSTGDLLASTGSPGADMDWREAYELLGGSAPGAVRIGIMDSGIQHDHEELQGRVAAEWDFFAGDGDASDDNGHGSHVAGISGARADNGEGVAGVAFGAGVEFVISKVCGPINPGPMGYRCPSSAIADGIVFAVDQGAQVLNLSLGGGGGSTTTREALQYARALDVLPVCAAGNEAGPVSYPAAWPECVAVSATDWSDGLASYSNAGPEVELAAPGGDDEDPNGYSYILSAYRGGPSEYRFVAGTSMAAPQVTGLAALLHSLGVTDDDEKLALMKSTADDLGASGADDLYGDGRINVHAAVQAARGGGGPVGNAPPQAAFSFSCDERACDFDASTSTDGDGSVVAYAWDFGDGTGGTGLSPSHTYPADGDYTVVLTVTDDDDATDTAEQSVTVTTAPAPGGLTLTAIADKDRGRHLVRLSWDGATSTDVDIERDGAVIATTANDGAYDDATGGRGGTTYTYRVCEAGTSVCSAPVTVVY